jgi:Zn-dependent alcohol dehydrogenase
MSIGRRAEKDVARSASVSRALVLERMGEPLRLVERPVPTPARGQIIVRNLATSINFHDVLNLQGVMPNVAWPRVPFSDNCGQIVAVGADCGGFRVGERVIANFFPDWLDGEPQPRYCDIVFGDQIDGFLQDHTVVDARSLVRAPAHLSAVEAATLPCAGLTAWRSVAVEARVQPGHVVVIQGTGGVALFALQFAKLYGAEVILISSSDEKLDFGRKLGADHTHNYRQDPAWDQKCSRSPAVLARTSWWKSAGRHPGSLDKCDETEWPRFGNWCAPGFGMTAAIGQPILSGTSRSGVSRLETCASSKPCAAQWSCTTSIRSSIADFRSATSKVRSR